MINISAKIASKIPKREFNGGRGERLINWFGRNVSTPENRLIIGVTALLSQPFIDLYNKDVDEETRVVSCARTIGKIVAGTLSGVAVRASFIHLVRNYSEMSKVGGKKIKKLFTPSKALPEMPYAYKQYQNAMGMFLAIGAMLVTNFAIDVPLTNFLTNNLTKSFKQRLKKSKEVSNESK